MCIPVKLILSMWILCSSSAEFVCSRKYRSSLVVVKEMRNFPGISMVYMRGLSMGEVLDPLCFLRSVSPFSYR